MIRNIRYQAYYINKWYDIERLELFPNGSMLPTKFTGFTAPVLRHKISLIRQMTEIQDKYKVDIWEMDILNYKTEFIDIIGVVEFDTKFFMGWVMRTSKGLIQISFDTARPEDLQVIGNAMKNPEYMRIINKKEKSEL